MQRTASVVLGVLFVGVAASPALACGGLIAPNGSVNLLRTATLAGYHNGVEHYITSFEFAGGGAKFGSIVPIPGMPKRVTRGGDWTLQRLQQETAPPQPVAAGEDGESSGGRAEEVYEKEIDGLLITILKGGSNGVGKWAKDEGFKLPPDAPEVLHFYAQRSPYFMAVRFIPKKAKKEQLNEGDGVPIHLRIETDNPWVPLRILALGKESREVVEADVYLLTDIEPSLLPQPVSPGERGLVIERSEQASDSLMQDLRDDRGSRWIPEDLWLTYLRIDSDARDLFYDLAVDASGNGQPSEEDAYGKQSDDDSPSRQAPSPWAWLLVPVLGFGALRFSDRLVMPRR